MTSIAGQVVLVTGAARGLGFEIARHLHDAGATVVLNDRADAAVAGAISRLGGGARLVSAPADLSTAAGCAAAVSAAIAAGGGLDALVNNAAVNVEKPIAETDDAHWDQHIAVCLKAPLHCARAAAPALAARRGAILNIASELGLHANPNNIAYVTAKHGLVALTRALAIELAPSGVRANALCPGPMDTELMRDCAEDSGDPEGYLAAFAGYAPIGRIVHPSDVAAFALALLTPQASYMTGATLAFDGGSTAGRL